MIYGIDRETVGQINGKLKSMVIKCYNWFHSSGKIIKCKVNWWMHLNITHTDVTINSIPVERTGLIDSWIFSETLALLGVFG